LTEDARADRDDNDDQQSSMIEDREGDEVLMERRSALMKAHY
jgi:hypothetical protein